MVRRLAAPAVVVFLGESMAAHAADRWSITAQGGADVEVSGAVLLSGQGAIAGLPTTIEGLSYRGAFSPSFRGAVSVGYRVSPKVEIFARGGHYSATGRSNRIGSAASLDLMGEAGPYREWTAEVGVRRFLARRGAFEPYLAVAGGARFLDAMTVTLSVPDAHLSATGLPLYDRSTVAVVGADVGALWRLSSHAFVGAEIGLRYQTAAAPLDTALQGSGLETINDGGSRWSLPVSAQVGMRF